MSADADRILGFALPGRDARGRVVRLGPVVSDILSSHAYPPRLASLLAEALALTALLGALLRPDEGKLTLQCQSDGPVTLLVCDWLEGEVRGYLQHGGEPPEGADLQATFGRGFLAISLDQTASSERYQGIVPLEGASLAAAAESYFNTSEQVPTLIRLSARDEDGAWTAGGLLVQHLPRGEQDGPRIGVSGDVEYLPLAGQLNWDHVRALAGTVAGDELTDGALTLEALLWRLFHEDETRVAPAVILTRGCRCSAGHIANVLRRFPEDELDAMRGDDGAIVVNCEFCAKSFPIVI